MHAQLRYAAVNGPDARCGAQHGSHRATTPAIISDLEYLQLWIHCAGTDITVYTALQDSCRDSVGSHMRIRVCRNRRTHVESR